MYLHAGLGEKLPKVHQKDGKTPLKDVVSAISMQKFKRFLIWEFSDRTDEPSVHSIDSFTGICSNSSETGDKSYSRGVYIYLELHRLCRQKSVA